MEYLNPSKKGPSARVPLPHRGGAALDQGECFSRSTML